MGRYSIALLAPLALSLSPDATAGAGPDVRVLSSLETVRRSHTPGGAREARIEAARGEAESFQVVVHAGAAAIGALSVEAEPLVGPGGARIAPSVYRVGFVELRTPSNVEGAPGAWPDPLIPAVDAYAGERRRAFPIAVEAGMDAAAWIDVVVPRTAPPGDYVGAVRVLDGGRSIARVPVSLRVHRFALPATSSLPVTFGFAASTAARGHFGRAPSDEEARSLARLYALAALRHRVSLHGGTMEPAAWTIERGTDGKPRVRLDPRAYDDEVGPFLDGTADPDGPARGARWTAFDLRLPAKLQGDERAAYARALAEHLASRGWLDRAFDFTADEPPDAQLPSVRARAERVHAAAPGVRTLVTRPPCAALAGAVDLFCPVVNLVDDKPGSPLEHPGERRVAGLDIFPIRGSGDVHDRPRGAWWWYQSCLSTGCDVVGGRYFTGWPSYAIDAPPVAHRVMEWLTFRYGAAGELYYNTVEAYASGGASAPLIGQRPMSLPAGDPWRDPRRHGGNGDGTLFYPGRPGEIGGRTDVPVESIRLKRIRDGLEDYEYLALLASRRGRAAADRIAARVARRTFDWDHDPSALLEARATLARALDETP